LVWDQEAGSSNLPTPTSLRTLNEPEQPSEPSPEEARARVPPYVALVRIGAVVAMSVAAAFGIFLLLAGGDYWKPGIVCLVLAVPFFFLMRFAERTAD
jgi:hypothetical protein